MFLRAPGTHQETISWQLYPGQVTGPHTIENVFVFCIFKLDLYFKYIFFETVAYKEII